ncbi:glycosyltransferase family 25 protein [Rahnella contaminans]|uniref:glycosyltransferase family 25 protein n=1 Tax=Rahnella contaminans TaxID=2703882 RepID=UPI003C3077F7
MKVFIINLKRSSERRVSIESQCKKFNLDYEFIDAVDGATLTPTEVKQHTRALNYANKPGEIGCALSHIAAYRKIADLKLDKALILEDDAHLTADILPTLAAIDSIRDTRPAITLLTITDQYLQRSSHIIDSKHAIHSVFEASLAHGYVINAAAALRALSALYPVWMVADRWQVFKEYSICEINAVVPPVITLSPLSKKSIINATECETEIHSIKKDIWKELKRKRPLGLKLKRICWLARKPVLKIVKPSDAMQSVK